MTKPPIISRRLLLAGFWLAGTSSLWAQVKRGTDQGIGGTGISRGDDHGIGGTGIVGVIQRFGSIFVNGERIGYAPDVAVRIDGEAASVKALRIGHVARVVAQRQANGMLTTNRIDLLDEAIVDRFMPYEFGVPAPDVLEEVACNKARLQALTDAGLKPTLRLVRSGAVKSIREVERLVVRAFVNKVVS